MESCEQDQSSRISNQGWKSAHAQSTLAEPEESCKMVVEDGHEFEGTERTASSTEDQIEDAESGMPGSRVAGEHGQSEDENSGS